MCHALVVAQPVGGAAVGADRGDRLGGREHVGDDRMSQTADERGEALLISRRMLARGARQPQHPLAVFDRQ